jgi:hypothetical protein
MTRQPPIGSGTGGELVRRCRPGPPSLRSPLTGGRVAVNAFARLLSSRVVAARVRLSFGACESDRHLGLVHVEQGTDVDRASSVLDARVSNRITSGSFSACSAPSTSHIR